MFLSVTLGKTRDVFKETEKKRKITSQRLRSFARREREAERETEEGQRSGERDGGGERER